MNCSDCKYYSEFKEPRDIGIGFVYGYCFDDTCGYQTRIPMYKPDYKCAHFEEKQKEET